MADGIAYGGKPGGVHVQPSVGGMISGIRGTGYMGRQLGGVAGRFRKGQMPGDWNLPPDPTEGLTQNVPQDPEGRMWWFKRGFMGIPPERIGAMASAARNYRGIGRSQAGGYGAQFGGVGLDIRKLLEARLGGI